MNIKTVLLTGARAPVTLDTARMFKLANIRVVCVDSLAPTITQFSASIDSYYSTCKPAEDLERFTKEINAIVAKENVDLIIPMCEEVLYLAKIQSNIKCNVFTSSFELVESFHNKWTFFGLLKDFPIRQPNTFLIRLDEDFSELPKNEKLIFKQVYSRFSANIIVKEKNDPFPNISHDQNNPYIAQEFIEGEKYCSFSVARNGKVTAFSEYQVLQSIGIGSAVAIKSSYHKEIYQFVSQFIAKYNYSGLISFDYIIDKHGAIYCIECNPRATSGLHLFNKGSLLPLAIMSDILTCIKVQEGIYQRSMMLSLWFGIVQKNVFQSSFWKVVLIGRSPLFWIKDIKPSLALPYIFFKIIKQSLKEKKGFHEITSQDLEYNGVFA
ncbi:MAG: ATP-grasp domain-containing protein [Rhabdochlamydiaceae bacterium]|nr:ATP-grasp domain-containing protein [Candidatus Amphrikana amoebophyrae]